MDPSKEEDLPDKTSKIALSRSQSLKHQKNSAETKRPIQAEQDETGSPSLEQSGASPIDSKEDEKSRIQVVGSKFAATTEAQSFDQTSVGDYHQSIEHNKDDGSMKSPILEIDPTAKEGIEGINLSIEEKDEASRNTIDGGEKANSESENERQSKFFPERKSTSAEEIGDQENVGERETVNALVGEVKVAEPKSQAANVNQQQVPAVNVNQQQAPAVNVNQQQAPAANVNQQQVPAVNVNQQQAPAANVNALEAGVADNNQAPQAGPQENMRLVKDGFIICFVLAIILLPIAVVLEFFVPRFAGQMLNSFAWVFLAFCGGGSVNFGLRWLLSGLFVTYPKLISLLQAVICLTAIGGLMGGKVVALRKEDIILECLKNAKGACGNPKPWRAAYEILNGVQSCFVLSLLFFILRGFGVEPDFNEIFEKLKRFKERLLVMIGLANPV